MIMLETEEFLALISLVVVVTFGLSCLFIGHK